MLKSNSMKQTIWSLLVFRIDEASVRDSRFGQSTNTNVREEERQVVSSFLSHPTIKLISLHGGGDVAND